MSKKLTTEEFIARAKSIHGDKYDYSKSEYVNNKTKVKIFCNTCQEYFSQTPDHHINKVCGCKVCGFISSKTKQTKSRNWFISQANSVHNNKYDYSNVKYINDHTNIDICCPIHGLFTQTPNNHLTGKGCSMCKSEKLSLIFRTPKDEFISNSMMAHNNKYDYSKVKYVNCDTHVTIICPTHGSFDQTPYNHFNRKCGCKMCSDSKGELKIASILTSLNIIYIREKRFQDCKNNRPLPFDFYIPDKHICIEFDGIQHFEPQRYSKSNETNINKFNLIKHNDNIKTKYCNDQNIKLLRIAYTDFDNVEEILKRELL